MIVPLEAFEKLARPRNPRFRYPIFPTDAEGAITEASEDADEGNYFDSEMNSASEDDVDIEEFVPEDYQAHPMALERGGVKWQSL
ncbi:hypothetical protein NEOLEDRAFT_1133321 [Neolentinus lepideus HHB14362 ss-1]|uniref:Uncharacterized protein n=1 Tax=Neolentinus lepideus HHB14362 ss-1 TaxID=1314782 RepID=A0A165SWK3_9AGAM|nr:hypothetical protein NEOLEDRAFT_1133321 [Neolentinus lepideus HHB14362 ss-1]